MFKNILLALLVWSSLSAQGLQIGSELSSLHKYRYMNQHEKLELIPNYISTIVVSFEKDNSAMINEFLQSKESDYLKKRNAIFIADISKMPSMVTKFFALPKMKKYKHTIYLHNTDEFAKYVPAKEDKATIIKFKGQTVTEISYISTVKELQGILTK